MSEYHFEKPYGHPQDDNGRPGLQTSLNLQQNKISEKEAKVMAEGLKISGSMMEVC